MYRECQEISFKPPFLPPSYSTLIERQEDSSMFIKFMISFTIFIVTHYDEFLVDIFSSLIMLNETS